MATACLNYFYDEVKLIKQAKGRLRKIYIYAWFGTLVIFSSQAFFSLRSAYLLTEDKYYPSRAVVYLQIEMPKGNIFSEYGWGGYLNWKLPQKRVFIDGRMPSWKWEANIPGEENYVMKVYTGILRGDTDFRPVFEKYNIDTVLWPRSKRKSFFNTLEEGLTNLLREFGLAPKEYDFIEELKKDGWEKTYEDSVATVYQRQKAGF